MDQWSAKDLKAFIEKNGGSYADCVEKPDFLARAKAIAEKVGRNGESGSDRESSVHVHTHVPGPRKTSKPPPTLHYDYPFLSKWRRAWASHENKPRVEAWMGFHASLRAQLITMGEVLNDAVRFASWTAQGRDLEKEAMHYVNTLLIDFTTFAARIGDHAAYEDQSLFPFFMDSLADFNAKGESLTIQHEEMEAMEADIKAGITTLGKAIEGHNFDEVKTVTPRLLAQYGEYHQLIIEHLATEETSIVGPWLHLTQEQYDDYYESYLKPSGHTMSSVPILGAVPMDEEEEERQAKKVLKQQEEKARAEEKERRAKKEKEAAKNQEEQKKKSTGLPKLYDRHGKEVDLSRPGCCFDGVDSCCKGSAYQKLLRQHGYEIDPKTGGYRLKK
mgnify:CR=1 FL=1